MKSIQTFVLYFNVLRSLTGSYRSLTVLTPARDAVLTPARDAVLTPARDAVLTPARDAVFTTGITLNNQFFSYFKFILATGQKCEVTEFHIISLLLNKDTSFVTINIKSFNNFHYQDPKHIT